MHSLGQMIQIGKKSMVFRRLYMVLKGTWRIFGTKRSKVLQLPIPFYAYSQIRLESA